MRQDRRPAPSYPYFSIFQQIQEDDLEFERIQEEQQRMWDEAARHAYEYDPYDKSDARNSFSHPHNLYDSYDSYHTF